MEACVGRESRPAFRGHFIRETAKMHQDDFSRIIDISRIYLSDIMEKCKYNRRFAFFENIFETLNIDLDWLTMVKIGIHLQVRKSSLNMIFLFREDKKKIIKILEYFKKSHLFKWVWVAYTSRTFEIRRHWIIILHTLYFTAISGIMNMAKTMPENQSRLKRRKI